MLKVLLADDDRVSCKMLGSLLQKWGYQIVIVHDGDAAARELMHEHAPQLAILDWEMPRLDGIDVVKAVRSAKHSTYIYLLLLTSRGEKEDVLKGLDAGADDYLKKPFDPDELRARVRAGERIIDLQSALIQAQTELEFAATHDSLTGLWNRGSIFELLKKELARRRRSWDPLGLALADIDHFKRVNDTYGHLVGDAVLREVTRRLAAEVRPYDAVGRYGGEEFLIVFPGCDALRVAAGADRLRRCIADHPIDTSAGKIQITISLGLSSVEEGEDGPTDCEMLLCEADEALYAAKASGRDRFVIAAHRPVG